jgi:hypothetical protein
MAVPFDPTDPAHLTPEQRFDELSALLAADVRRARLPQRMASLPRIRTTDGCRACASVRYRAKREHGV